MLGRDKNGTLNFGDTLCKYPINISSTLLSATSLPHLRAHTGIGNPKLFPLLCREKCFVVCRSIHEGVVHLFTARIVPGNIFEWKKGKFDDLIGVLVVGVNSEHNILTREKGHEYTCDEDVDLSTYASGGAHWTAKRNRKSAVHQSRIERHLVHIQLQQQFPNPKMEHGGSEQTYSPSLTRPLLIM